MPPPFTTVSPHPKQLSAAMDTSPSFTVRLRYNSEIPVLSVSVPAPVFTMSVYLPNPLPSSTSEVIVMSEETGSVRTPPVR